MIGDVQSQPGSPTSGSTTSEDVLAKLLARLQLSHLSGWPYLVAILFTVIVANFNTCCSLVSGERNRRSAPGESHGGGSH